MKLIDLLNEIEKLANAVGNKTPDGERLKDAEVVVNVDKDFCKIDELEYSYLDNRITLQIE